MSSSIKEKFSGFLIQIAIILTILLILLKITLQLSTTAKQYTAETQDKFPIISGLPMLLLSGLGVWLFFSEYREEKNNKNFYKLSFFLLYFVIYLTYFIITKLIYSN